MNDIRNSGRAWPPTAPEFRAICLNAGMDKHPPLEAAYAEINRIVSAGRKDYSNVSPILYHTIVRNLDFYNFRQVEEWKAYKMFEVAYKATLFQLECGEELVTPPPPETLLENKSSPKQDLTSEDIEKGEQVFKSLLSMFDEPETKPLTPAEIADNERLEKLK